MVAITSGATAATGNVLANDTATGGTASVTAVAGAGGAQGVVDQPLIGNLGTLTINADGGYSYAVASNAAVVALAAGATATDAFTYTPSVGGVAAAPQTLTVTVTGVNNPPTPVNDVGFSVSEDLVAVSSANVLTNDTDPDVGNSLTVTAIAGGSLGVALVGTYGSLVLNADGSFTYALDNADPDTQALAAGQTGFDSFIYSVSDGTATSTATLRMSVFGANDAPVAVNDVGFSVIEDSVAVSSANVLANDRDPDSSLTVIGLTGGALGTPLVGTFGALVLNANGTFIYTLNNADPDTQALTFTRPGSEVFTYTVSDGLLTSSATLTITIGGTGDASAPTTLDLLREDDTGSLATDNITQRTSGLTIEGLAEAGVRVDILEGVTVLATTTADAGGVFRADISLVAGTHPVTARAMDVAGNISALSAPLSIIVDSTIFTGTPDLVAASDTGRSSTDNISRGVAPVIFSGFAEPFSVVELFIRQPFSVLATTTAAVDGSYSFAHSDFSIVSHRPSGFVNSDVTFAVATRATDAAGNVGLSDDLTLRFDTQRTPLSNLQLLPTDDTGVPGDRITNKSMVTITGTTEAGAEVSFNGSSVLAGPDGSFALQVALQNGANTIIPVSVDIAGNTTATLAVQSSIVVTRDAILGAVVEQIPIFDDGTSQLVALASHSDVAPHSLHQDLLPIA